ncbi:WD40 repeat domain-containing protein [Symmachiella dynata]|uniref:WD40 repeat domain-containing protein n=1 Tax=Symmachiella dynata TaxID=2527995 RepID=UPI0030EDCB22
MKTYLCAMFRQQVWVLLLAVLVSVSIVGCGGADEDATTTPATESSSNNQAPQPAKADASNDAEPSPPEGEPFEPLELLSTMVLQEYSLGAFTFAPDSTTFVTGGGEPKVWRIGDEEPLHIFEGLYPLTGTIVEADTLAISANGKLLAIGGGDGLVHLFDFENNELLHSIEANEAGIVSVAFSQDGKRLVSSGYDGLVKTWNTETAEPLAVINTESQKAVRSDITPDGKTVLSAGDEVFLWNAESGDQLGALGLSEPRAVFVREAKFSADGKQVVTADLTVDFENAALVWTVDTRKIIATLKHEFGVGAVSFSPDGKLLATGDMDTQAQIWDIAAQKSLQTIIEEGNTVDEVAWSPDGKLLAIVSDGTIRFYGRPGTIKTSAAKPQDSSTEPPLEADTVGAPADEPETPAPPTVKLPEAATMEQIVAMLDLEKFPRIEGGDYQTTEKNNIGYLAPLTIPEAREFYREKLSAAGWQEREQSVAALDTDQSWLRIYEKEGYLLRLYFNTLGDSVEGQKTTVEFLHMGNIDTRKLPAPAGGEATFETPEFTSYTADIDPDEAIEDCRRQITALGWKEESVQKSNFGAAITFVQNAITLTARIQPGTGGQTLVMYDVAAHAK